MNEKVKRAYNTIVQYVINNSFLEKSKYDVNFINEREKKWLELVPAIYVMGPKNQMNFFEEEAKTQGFLQLVNFLYPKMINDLIHTHPDEYDIIIDWITEEYGGEFYEGVTYEYYILGCHISHVIISMDIIRNNHKRALVFENDAKFYEYVSNQTIDKLIEIYEKDINEEIGYLNLGFTTESENQEELKILKGQTPTTHTYIINQETSKLLIDSINTEKEMLKQIHPQNNEKEISYRGGADGFFSGFIQNFYLNLPLTYQQFIGTNREQNYI